MKKLNVDVMNINGRDRHKGAVAKEVLTQGVLDPGASRPWLDPDTGVSYVTVYDTVKKGDPNDLESYVNIPLNTNATLMKDEWEQLEDGILAVKEDRLVGIQDLIQNNMTQSLNNPMATPQLTHQKGNVDFDATMSMDGVTRGQNNRPSFEYESIPIPLLHVDFDINQRDLLVSRKQGNGIDVLDAQEATRTINEKLEDMLFSTSFDWSYAGGKLQSYTTFDDRVTGSFTSWITSSKTPTQVVDDVRSMKQDMRDNKCYGNMILYLPAEYETVLDGDYDNTRGNTVRQRIEDIGGIDKVQIADKLASGNMLLIEKNKENIHLIQGMDMQTIEWSEQAGMMNKFKVITIQVPRLRSDVNGRIGIVHYSTP